MSRYVRMAVFGLLALLIVTSLIGVPANAQAAPTVKVGGNAELGAFLVAGNDLTLYTFANDKFGVSNCVDACAQNWPPLTIEKGMMPTAGEGVPGKLGTLERADGSVQVTYNDMPLYFWKDDKAAGDAKGHKVRDVWFVVKPETLVVGGNADLGAFLIAANGRTVYTFKNDEPGKSNCVDACAQNWPPLTIAANDGPIAGRGVTGKLGTITRADGSLQVTYNDMPLYFWKDDAAKGDAKGHKVRDVWFVVQPATLQIGGNEALGKFIVAANGLTLYTFKNDEPGKSNCVDACAQNWPPLTVVAGETPLADAGLTGKVGTITRADGRLQVTYNDMPLYFWKDDKVPGDARGHNVREVWFVLKAE